MDFGPGTSQPLTFREKKPMIDLAFWACWLTAQMIIAIEAYWTLRLFGLVK